MTLRCLVRVGRWWLNPRYLISIEDPAAPAQPQGDDQLVVVMERGEEITLRGEDAALLRRLLAEAQDDEGQGPGQGRPHGDAPTPAGPRRTHSGRGTRPRPPIERDDPPEARQVTE